MKATVTMIALAVLMLGVTSAHAVDMPALAKTKNCVSCHSVDKKMVGPSWKEIAAKNKGNANAEATLSAKIILGGSGVWGPVPMPPNNVTDAEAKELVKFILGL